MDFFHRTPALGTLYPVDILLSFPLVCLSDVFYVPAEWNPILYERLVKVAQKIPDKVGNEVVASSWGVGELFGGCLGAGDHFRADVGFSHKSILVFVGTSSIKSFSTIAVMAKNL